MLNLGTLTPGFHLDFFFAFSCSFWFFVPTNEQQKAKTSNQSHFLVLGFEIELILSQKQERATKSKEK